MTTETLEKCLRFVAGDKDYQVAYNIKKPDFPDNLLAWNKKEQSIMRSREEGLSFDEIREKLGKNVRSGLYYTLDIVQRKEELYGAWTEFWEAIEPIRDITLAELCKDSSDDKRLQRWVKRFKDGGVVTVGDFLMECVTMPMSSMAKKFGSTNLIVKPVKTKILEKVRVRIETNK